ncbi:DUF86 domain-containing protein, partial [Klebsiella pneumoniae]|nr:DUF86 domain-containing protein [Klebsiella pneumoniae]
DIEEWLVARANKFTQKYPSVLEAIRTLYKKEVLNDNQYYPLNQLRNFRNKLVHEPKRIEAEEVALHMDLADDLLKALRAIEP